VPVSVPRDGSRPYRGCSWVTSVPRVHEDLRIRPSRSPAEESAPVRGRRCSRVRGVSILRGVRHGVDTVPDQTCRFTKTLLTGALLAIGIQFSPSPWIHPAGRVGADGLHEFWIHRRGRVTPLATQIREHRRDLLVVQHAKGRSRSMPTSTVTRQRLGNPRSSSIGSTRSSSTMSNVTAISQTRDGLIPHCRLLVIGI